MTGELEVLYFDDFENHRGEQRYFVHDKRQNKRYQLEFQGEPPAGATTGSFVRVRGKGNDQQIFMAANGTNSYETLAAASTMVSGDQKTIVFVADFNDKAVSCPVADIEDLMFTDSDFQSIDDLYRETSLDKIQFSGTVVGPFSIDYSSTDACDITAWADAIEAQAQASSINLGEYNRKVYVLPPNKCGSYGLSTIGGNPSRSWIFRCDVPDVFAHELGHGLGMGHAGNTIDDYDDISDVMGYSDHGLRQINGPHQEQMGWRDPQQIVEINTNGIYDIAPLELDSSVASAPQLLKIRKPDTAEWYYLSFRQAIGFDQSLSNNYLSGLSIHQHAGNGSTSKTVWKNTLLDGENFADSVNSLSITQLAHDENSVTIQVSLPNICTRNQPTVSLTPQSQTDLAGSTLSYDVNITNNDSANCSDSSWSVATQIPSDWPEVLSSNEITIAPGSNTSINWQVSSADSAVDNNYALTVDLVDAGTITHDKTMAANYTVTTPGDTQPPSAPTGLTATAQRKKIIVSWQSSTDNIAVAGYKLFRNDIQVATTASISYSDASLTSGETYAYYAVAFDVANNLSLSSKISSVTFGKGGGGGGSSKGGGKKR